MKTKAQIYEERLQYAIDQLNDIDIYVDVVSDKEIRFEHKGETIKFFPFKGWATGKSIKDCRGIRNLINQLKN